MACSDRVIQDPEHAVKVGPGPSPTLQMVCRNEECAASGLMHARCFEKLEDQACKALARTVRAQKWTEGQVETSFL